MSGDQSSEEDATELRPGLPAATKAYACVDIFQGTKPVLYVTRPDGSWCVLCGGDHPQDSAEYRVVHLGHEVGKDPSLREVLDLDSDEEAERSAQGLPWVRSSF